jgi:hypothetical protein
MKYEMEVYRETYTGAAPDYPGIQTTIVNSSDWMGFLTVLSGNQVVIVHSLGLFSSGLGSPTRAHNRIFGLVGERVGSDMPPNVMAPSPGLVPWLKIQACYRPDTEELMALDGSESFAIPRPTIEVDDDEVSVQNICFIPIDWAPYFLAPLSPYLALQTFSFLLQTIPPNLHSSFDFLGMWLSIACTYITTGAESMLKSNWQNPPAERWMISWMQRHTLYVSDMPAVALGGNPGLTLDSQECLNKALETVAALCPISETAATKKYTPVELRRLPASCSLNITEMESALPDFHEQLLTEGRTKKGTESVLA